MFLLDGLVESAAVREQNSDAEAFGWLAAERCQAQQHRQTFRYASESYLSNIYS